MILPNFGVGDVCASALLFLQYVQVVFVPLGASDASGDVWVGWWVLCVVAVKWDLYVTGSNDWRSW